MCWFALTINNVGWGKFAWSFKHKHLEDAVRGFTCSTLHSSHLIREIVACDLYTVLFYSRSDFPYFSILMHSPASSSPTRALLLTLQYLCQSLANCEETLNDLSLVVSQASLSSLSLCSRLRMHFVLLQVVNPLSILAYGQSATSRVWLTFVFQLSNSGRLTALRVQTVFT